MNTKKILVTLSTFCEYSDEARTLLRKTDWKVVENETGCRMKPEEILAAGTDWAGLVAGVEPYTSDTLSKMSKLACISRVGTGIDSIDLDYAREHGIVVRNTPDVPVDAVAEMAIGLMLDLCRKISWQDSHMKKQEWVKATGVLLHGKTVGIIGVGKIGKRVAELLRAFDVTLLGFDPSENVSWAEANNLTYCSFEQLLERSDMVTVHMSGRKDSDAVIGEREISLMKTGAFLINTSRGNLVDLAAVQKGLEEGKLAGVGLDVFSDEPYSGPLCGCEQAVLVPHVSTLTKETRAQMELGAVKNLIEELEKK